MPRLGLVTSYGSLGIGMCLMDNSYPKDNRVFTTGTMNFYLFLFSFLNQNNYHHGITDMNTLVLDYRAQITP